MSLFKKHIAGIPSHRNLVFAFVSLTSICLQQTGVADETIEYNRDIQPILADQCFACHGADSAARQADLRLDKREAAVDSGAIVPGKPEESEFIARLFSDDPDLLMPPPETKKKLSADDKEKLKRWIASGAEYQQHWSFIPPQKAVPPAVQHSGWARNEIDQFILAGLEKRQLKPAPEADARTLFRRLHLDITGLPPAPTDINAFTADFATDKEAAVSNWIDKLLESPAWGEHRARYWLDAARYGDTHGLHFDNYREMWPYRDWVIRAFNANQPFDQFALEQIAGDLLPDHTDDQLIATGFQRCNITTNEGGTIDEENMALYATDRVQTFGWVFLGLTTNCGQCHDHKFDPFTMKDYYSLAAYFRNTTQPPKDGNVKDGGGPVLIVPSPEDRPRWEALPRLIADTKAARDDRRQKALQPFQEWSSTATADSLKTDVATENLQLHVPLNEGSGNPVKAIGHEEFVVNAIGEISWTPDGRLGPTPVTKSGSTFNLGQYGDFEKDQGFSFGAWIRTGRNNISGGILAKMEAPERYRGWDLWQQGTTLAVHIIDSWPNNALKVTTNETVLKPGQWQHVFATYDGSGRPEGVRIYVDGRNIALRTENSSLGPDASIRTDVAFRVGQRTAGQYFEDGAVQDVRIYDRMLTASEVKAIGDMAPVRTILQIDIEQRTPEQTDTLFEYYLATIDEDYSRLAADVSQLEAEHNTIKARSPVTHIQQERKDSPAMAFILTRGEYDRKGEQVTAAPPEALHPMPDGAPANRLGLSQWLLDSRNPLTARVTVNRFWQEIFGQGLVVTPEDFGVMGSVPSNQQLLDWLAVDFVENGWDIKRFFKQVFMSSTYRQAAIVSPEKIEQDRSNALLSRGPRFRMDAEMVRDLALASSGLLSSKMYGRSVKPYQPQAIWDLVGLPGGDTRNYVQDSGDDLYRRTLYTFWKRMAPPPNLEAFNAPSREVCTVRRERTNTPLQALVTLNDPQFVEAQRHLADQAMTLSGNNSHQILDEISQRVLARPFNETERDTLLGDYREFLKYYQSKPEDATALISVGESSATESLDHCQLAAWTMVCNEVMNLDEALNK